MAPSRFCRGLSFVAACLGNITGCFVYSGLHKIRSPSFKKSCASCISRKLSYFPKLFFKSYNTQLSKTFVQTDFFNFDFSARKTLRHIDILGFGTIPLPWTHLSLSLHTWHHIILMFTPLDKSVEEIFAWESKIILF